jgi:hypothetical protein
MANTKSWAQVQAEANAAQARINAMSKASGYVAPLAKPAPKPQPIGLLNRWLNFADTASGEAMNWLKGLTPEQRRKLQEARDAKIEKALREAGA